MFTQEDLMYHTYMSNAQRLFDSFFQLKKSLEKELKIVLENSGTIKLKKSIAVDFTTSIGRIPITHISLDDYDVVMLESNLGVKCALTDMENLDDFYKLCKELGV